MENYDFIGLGDITNDAFIKVSEAEVLKDNNGKKDKLCLNFADKILYDWVKVIKAVGNSANASVCAKRLGLNSAIVTNIGDDDYGKNCIKRFEEQEIGTEYITVHKGKETNYNFLILFEEERTILSKHRHYEYKLPDFGSPKWLYFSSLGKDSEKHHEEIAEYVESRPEINLVFQPGTVQIRMGYEPLKRIYKLSKLFFCNKKEAQRILKTEEKDMKELLKLMHNLGPKIVVLTDGVNGSYVYDGNEGWHIPMYPDIAPPVDRTGAGDSFSSTFTIAIALGKSIEEALMWGPINSMSVVQKVGAQEGLLTKEELEKYLENKPDFYKPTKII